MKGKMMVQSIGGVKNRKGIGWLDRIKNAAPVFGVFMAGFAVSSAICGVSIFILLRDNTRMQSELLQAQDKISKVKSDSYRRIYDVDSVIHEDGKDMPHAKANAEGRQVADNTNTHREVNGGEISEISSVTSGNTVTFFSGDVFVSLIGLNFSGVPLRDLVTASIGSQGVKQINMVNEDIGETKTITTRKGKYEVRLISADTFGASFRVTRVLNNQ